MMSRHGKWVVLCIKSHEGSEGYWMIGYIFGAVVIAFVAVLAYGGITGKVRMDQGCCAPSDPSRDLRMRDS